MKKLMMMAAAVMVAVAAMAQGPAKGRGMKGGNVNPEKRARKVTDWMKKEVNLTAEQEPKVYNINLTAIKSLVQLKRDSTMAQDLKKQKAKEIHKSRLEQLKAVLTPEQQDTLKAKMKERKMAKRNGQPGKQGQMKQNKQQGGFQLTDDELEEVLD